MNTLYMQCHALVWRATQKHNAARSRMSRQSSESIANTPRCSLRSAWASAAETDLGAQPHKIFIGVAPIRFGVAQLFCLIFAHLLENVQFGLYPPCIFSSCHGFLVQSDIQETNCSASFFSQFHWIWPDTQCHIEIHERRHQTQHCECVIIGPVCVHGGRNLQGKWHNVPALCSLRAKLRGLPFFLITSSVNWLIRFLVPILL